MEISDKVIPYWLWLKKYFDTGYGLMNYLRAVLTVVGIGGIANNWNYKIIVAIGLFYAIICLLSGWLWVKFRLTSKEDEINNILNPFQREVREKLWKK